MNDDCNNLLCCISAREGKWLLNFSCAQGVTASVQLCLGGGDRRKLWVHSSRVVSSRGTADSDKDEWLKRARD